VSNTHEETHHTTAVDLGRVMGDREFPATPDGSPGIAGPDSFVEVLHAAGVEGINA